jgi:hypothetical protein
MADQASFVFLKDPENAWIPAKMIRNNGKTADVEIPLYNDEMSTICDGGKSAKKWVDAEVDLSDYNKGVLPMQNVDESGKMTCFEDMVNLPFLHEVRNWISSLFCISSRKTNINFYYRRLLFFIT